MDEAGGDLVQAAKRPRTDEREWLRALPDIQILNLVCEFLEGAGLVHALVFYGVLLRMRPRRFAVVDGFRRHELDAFEELACRRLKRLAALLWGDAIPMSMRDQAEAVLECWIFNPPLIGERCDYCAARFVPPRSFPAQAVSTDDGHHVPMLDRKMDRLWRERWVRPLLGLPRDVRCCGLCLALRAADVRAVPHNDLLPYLPLQGGCVPHYLVQWRDRTTFVPTSIRVADAFLAKFGFHYDRRCRFWSPRQVFDEISGTLSTAEQVERLRTALDLFGEDLARLEEAERKQQRL